MFNPKISVDHKPAKIEIDRMPDGTAWIRLHKNTSKAKLPEDSPEGMATGYVTDEAVCLLLASRAENETAATIEANFDEWFEYASNWTPADNEPQTLEQRVDDLAELCANMIDL